MSLYVQFGSGLSCPEGWVSFDSSPTLRLQRLPLVGTLAKRIPPRFPDGVKVGDIVSGLPLQQSSVDAMYCSHVLEHLALDDLRRALRNCLSYLRPGSPFRLVVPDLANLIADYMADGSVDAVSSFMERAHLGQRSRPRGLVGMARSVLGNSQHLWMWDEKGLSEELRQAGFANIRRATYGDSAYSCYSSIEQADRWSQCLGLECIRPAAS